MILYLWFSLPPPSPLPISFFYSGGLVVGVLALAATGQACLLAIRNDRGQQEKAF